MALLTLQNICISFGGPKILDNLSLQIEKNQRICLLGRNGTGKSTLMKILAGNLKPDAGNIIKDKGIKVSYFTQTIPEKMNGTAFEIIAQGLGKRGKLLLEYFIEVENSEIGRADKLGDINFKMDHHNGWAALDEIEKTVSQMSLNKSWIYNELSGGQKRRVILASALVSNPDLLLLDEPTNHLDVESITWMEDYLIRSSITLLFVTHDRMLLRKLSNRIIELDRGQLVDWSCDYDTFLQRKQDVLDAEQKEWDRFDKKLAQEEVWIRQGIKARRTRNEGRVCSLLKMRQEREKRREREGVASFGLQDGKRSGALVLEAKDVSCGYTDNHIIIKKFNISISRGDKIGIIGKNGCGKSTLVNTLLGNLKQCKGSIRHGTNLEITYFDQLRESLIEDKSVWENVLPNGESVIINGKSKHIISYLQDFLFTPERAKTPVTNLSGGERNRLLLARLFTKSSNLLVLDEPTNDLDAETLELLEELLVNYKGTLLLICHDRTFINNVVTSTIIFLGNGEVKEFVGGYDEVHQYLISEEQDRQPKERLDKKKLYKEEKKLKKKNKITFKETNELKVLPEKIEELEAEQQRIHGAFSDPEFYKTSKNIVETKNRLEEVEAELSNAYNRWEYLESKKAE